MNQTNIEAQMKALHQDMKTLKEKASRFSTIRFLLVIRTFSLRPIRISIITLDFLSNR